MNPCDNENEDVYKLVFTHEREKNRRQKTLQNTKEFLMRRVLVSIPNLYHECLSISPDTYLKGNTRSSPMNKNKSKKKKNNNFQSSSQFHLCYSKCVLDFKMTKNDCINLKVSYNLYCHGNSTITRQKCWELMLNPDLYYCNRGLFHMCDERCPGGSGTLFDNICFISRRSKSRILSSFSPPEDPNVFTLMSSSKRERGVSRSNDKSELDSRLSSSSDASMKQKRMRGTKKEREREHKSRGRLLKNLRKSTARQKKDNSKTFGFSESYQTSYNGIRTNSKMLDDSLNSENRRLQNKIEIEREKQAELSKIIVDQPLNVDLKIRRRNRLRKPTKLLIGAKGLNKEELEEIIRVIKIFTLQTPIKVNTTSFFFLYSHYKLLYQDKQFSFKT